MTTPFDLAALPLDASAWEAAAERMRATVFASEKLRLATRSPRTWDDVVGVASSGELRANVVTLAAYLDERGIGGEARTIAGGGVRRFTHHGDLHVGGDVEFLREQGAMRANLVTGTVRVDGIVRVSAFDGELMIGGDLECAALHTDAEVGVGGVVRCRFARLGWYDCTTAFSALKAELVIDHGQVVEGQIEATVVITCDDHCTSLPASERDKVALLADELRDAVDAAGDDEDEAYAALVDAALKAVAAGRPLLR